MSNFMEVDHSRVRRIAERLVARRETIAVSESSAGGLISAALLAVPGASAYFVGGGVIYTRKAMGALLELGPDKLEGIRSATEPMARLLAETVRLSSAPIGDWPKPAPPARPATAMATPPGTPASRSRDRSRRAGCWTPDRATGWPTWSRSRMRRSNCWRNAWAGRADVWAALGGNQPSKIVHPGSRRVHPRCSHRPGFATFRPMVESSTKCAELSVTVIRRNRPANKAEA
jgi:hypothetical protein